MDGWLNFTVDPSIAAKIVALRPCIEALLVTAVKDTDSFSSVIERYDQVIEFLPFISVSSILL